MDIVKVKGRNRGDILLYALSTCGWCRKTKAFLDHRGVAYSYVDVDLVPEAEQEAVMAEVRKWNPECTFPTVVVDGRRCIRGYKPDELEEVAGR